MNYHRLTIGYMVVVLTVGLACLTFALLNFPLEKFTVKFITMKSARGHSYKACELALEQIASKRFPLELITTHKFGLKDVDLAIRSVGNEGVPDVIHASLMPWE